MNKILTDKFQEIERLCQRYHVRKLEVFGSVTGVNFDPETSDIDLLVDFDDVSVDEYADNYFGFQSALQELLGLPIELVVTATLKNPYFLESIEADRRFLYAA
ncbi:nucleotidyltransferase family protein [Leucothrix mucor]|uniref:nucleotidyltransferase family protein n=1 Tax=Leucothrix mucor TaxID=45248 RepID=UPI0003B60899|nr:nucleotidyltransferase domain-containing protein [Leucothrix mucor]